MMLLSALLRFDMTISQGGAAEYDVNRIVVASTRHRASDLPATRRSGELDRIAKAKGYEVFHKDAEYLLVDRSLFGALPSVLQARTLEYFSGRGYASVPLDQMPAGLREGVADAFSATLPPGDSYDPRTSVEFRAEVRVKPVGVKEAPGRPAARDIVVPHDALPKVKLPFGDFPEAETPVRLPISREVRIFFSGHASEAGVLEAWDELRPLMLERQKEYVAASRAAVGAYKAATEGWLRGKAGFAAKGEPQSFSAMSAEGQALVKDAFATMDRKGTFGWARGGLAGERYTMGDATCSFGYHGAKGSDGFYDLNMIGRT